jgi:hypothetical protein
VVLKFGPLPVRFGPAWAGGDESEKQPAVIFATPVLGVDAAEQRGRMEKGQDGSLFFRICLSGKGSVESPARSVCIFAAVLH